MSVQSGHSEQSIFATRSPLVAGAMPDRVAIVLLLAAGAAERVVLLLTSARHDLVGGEAANVAIAFARTGGIADVFGRGGGPTAHLNPVMPALAGLVYRWLGVQTPKAETALGLIAIACVLAGAWLFCRALTCIGVSRGAVLATLALFCLLPINKYLELVDFRAWEGGLATLLGAATLLSVARADAAGELSSRAALAIALFAALTFFISPPLGLACYVCAAILMLRRVPAKRWAATAALAAVTLVAVLAPWTIRNYQAFGRFVPLRGNFGLELAIGNHPAAVSGVNALQVFRDRLGAIHPLESRAAFDAMQHMGGEIPYADRLGDQTKHWIAAHPGAFARLTLRHFGQLYFPPLWQSVIYGGNPSMAQKLRLAVLWPIAALGLLGAAFALLAWRGRFVYLGVFALVPALPYVVVQPVPRYSYLLFLPLLALAAELVSRALDRSILIGSGPWLKERAT